MPLPISAIVVVKNGEKTIGDCLKSLRVNDPAEIIIVDGKSTDRTREIASQYTQRIYSDEGQGVSVAHQIGAEQATQEYIVYIDSDIILTDGALADMLEEFKTGGYANLQATVLPRNDSSYWAWAIEQHVQFIRKRTPGGLSTGLLRKDTTLKIGFDSSVRLAGDDYDFLSRLKGRGYRLGTSSIVVYHQHPTSIKQLARTRFWYGRSKPRLVAKHGVFKPELWPPLVTSYWLAYCVVKFRFNLIPYFLVGGTVETAGMIKGFFEMLGHAKSK